MIRPPEYRDEIMKVVNLHEFEDLAKKNVSIQAYNYIAAGAADELTLQANRSAFGDFWVRRKVMVDVSTIDTTVELLGRKLEHPILLGPVGLRTLMNPDGERMTARAAAHTKSILVGVQPSVVQELAKTNQAPMWWAATLGHATQEEAASWAKRNEELGASALCVTVDYPYTGARDRPSRDQWESEFARTGVYSTEKGSLQFQPGMLDPYTPDLTWSWIKWARSASKLPIVVKGVLTGEDARLCVDNGAQAVVVSNHGARTLDGTAGTLQVLAEVVDAVNGRVPVLVDGGIRRGGDIVKAVALGAKAILIGRPYLWGLGAFGQDGVQRVIELLHGELRIALALSGAGSLSALNRSFIRQAWKAYKPTGSASAQAR
jgi:isopentenyl diphosphate isomerase/L-lactate dehydrogenase-like FMN-dependent dehydrogenase